MKLQSILIGFIVLVGFPFLSVFADTVILRDGTVVQGGHRDQHERHVPGVMDVEQHSPVWEEARVAVVDIAALSVEDR